MGQQIVEQLLPALSKMQWPTNGETTLAGQKTYDVALEQVAAGGGVPQSLAKALRTLQTGDSRPYALAGVAYVLVAAAREADGTYAQDGLAAALEWLEEAQNTAPDNVNVNFIEALIYIYGQRYDDARLVLDYLQNQEADNYLVCRAEIDYWRRVGNLEQALAWCQKTMTVADTVPRRLRLQKELAQAYFAAGYLDKALEAYKEAIHFDKDNYELWHKVSVIYWQKEDYESAEQYNKRALALNKNFPAGRKMADALQDKSHSKGLMDRLLGR